MGNVINENSLITDGSDASERLNKEHEYFDYIVEHIRNVKSAFQKLFVPLIGVNVDIHSISNEELQEAILLAKEKIETHDGSKFSDAEFDGYRAKYHPTANEEKGDDEYQEMVNARYQECWKHHYENNDHHPEYWYDFETNTPHDMSLDAIVHMICDWEAMSMKFGGSTLGWYENDNVEGKRKKERYLTARSKQILEELMYNILFN